MQNLNDRNVCQRNNIPVNLMKACELVFSYWIYHNFNNPLFNSPFPLII